MEQFLTGTIHGNTIVLDSPPNVPEGERVEVRLRSGGPEPSWGEGIVQSAGGWADFPEMDEIMDKVHAERKLERRQSSAP